MTRYVECATQADLDAVPAGEIAVVCSGTFVASGSSHVEASGSSRVVAREFSRVVASGSSRVVAREFSRVVASGSSHVVALEFSHVVASGSSHVVALESSHVDALGSSRVEAGRWVSVHRHSPSVTVVGGIVIDVPAIETAQDWCDYHGVKVARGWAVLYKAVGDDWRGGHRGQHAVTYAPGSKPTAPDWSPEPQCGGGLHFSPHPTMARSYHREATRYVACKVKVAEMVMLGDKVKAPRCTVLHQVDEWGDEVVS